MKNHRRSSAYQDRNPGTRLSRHPDRSPRAFFSHALGP